MKAELLKSWEGKGFELLQGDCLERIEKAHRDNAQREPRLVTQAIAHPIAHLIAHP